MEQYPSWLNSLDLRYDEIDFAFACDDESNVYEVHYQGNKRLVLIGNHINNNPALHLFIQDPYICNRDTD